MKENNKYKIVSNYIYNPSQVLGIGTLGVVYKAALQNPLNQKQSQKRYALKKINKYKIESSQSSFQKYQSQVISLQRAINIEQVISFKDFFKSKSYYYIVTQYFQGSQDLYNYMDKNQEKFTEKQAREIWKSILHAIQQLHNLDIFHRDLKLQNILYIPNTGKTKVIDFGLAVCFPDPETGGKVGSPLFMAPQVLTQTKYTKKCDLWSIGIVFYWMIFRTSPYGSNPSINKILNGMDSIRQKGVQFPPNKYISQSCKQVIISCLQWNQQDRLQIDKILSLDFFNTPKIIEENNIKKLDIKLLFDIKN